MNCIGEGCGGKALEEVSRAMHEKNLRSSAGVLLLTQLSVVGAQTEKDER